MIFVLDRRLKISKSKSHGHLTSIAGGRTRDSTILIGITQLETLL